MAVAVRESEHPRLYRAVLLIEIFAMNKNPHNANEPLPTSAHTLQHDSERSLQRTILRREASPAKRAALERARRRLGASLSQSEGTTLTSIRLSKGLSQAALAAMIGQSQPYIARLEKERQDLRSKTISKLAKALDVSADVIIEVTQPQDANE